jgi:hypothetical protein
MELNQEKWKEDHLEGLHVGILYDWCLLCQNLKNENIGGEDLGVSVGEVINSKDKFGG